MADLEYDANHKGTVLRDDQRKQMGWSCRRDYCLSIPCITGEAPPSLGFVYFLTVMASSDVCASLCTVLAEPYLKPVFSIHTEKGTWPIKKAGVLMD